MPTPRKTPVTETETENTQQIIESAIASFVAKHPEVRQSAVVTEIPAPLKWAGMILAALMTTSITAGAIWLVSTVSEMQVTLARMDERMGQWVASNKDRYADLDKRLSKIEDQMNEKDKGRAAE